MLEASTIAAWLWTSWQPGWEPPAKLLVKVARDTEALAIFQPEQILRAAGRGLLPKLANSAALEQSFANSADGERDCSYSLSPNQSLMGGTP